MIKGKNNKLATTGSKKPPEDKSTLSRKARSRHEHKSNSGKQFAEKGKSVIAPGIETAYVIAEAIASNQHFEEAFSLLKQIHAKVTHADTAEHGIEEAKGIPQLNDAVVVNNEQLVIDLKKQNSKLSAEVERLQAEKQKLLSTAEGENCSNHQLKTQNEQLIADNERLHAQVERFMGMLKDRNISLTSAQKENEELKGKLAASEKYRETMEHSLNGLSASVFGMINQPLKELELRLSVASGRQKPLKSDLNAAMSSVSSLRAVLEKIDIGGGYSISIMPCVDVDTWLKRKIVPYNDELHSGGELGSDVIVRSRGFKYLDVLGEEKIVKAEVFSEMADEKDNR